VRAGPKAGPATGRISESHALELAAREQDQKMAARVVASRSTGVDDCRELLGMLGLAGVTGLPVVESPPRR
jgi:hypothetical protein